MLYFIGYMIGCILGFLSEFEKNEAIGYIVGLAHFKRCKLVDLYILLVIGVGHMYMTDFLITVGRLLILGVLLCINNFH